uniref:Mediator of RNA polymerase II transcription subunit 17 n=1 Tax=Meloidogyne incognita TaxID=6306 RepID=A0A914LE35_MELIC
MYGQSTSNSNNGVQICVEPLSEWKIQEITYDGYEKYIKPSDFKDVLRKNARRIKWRKIVGNDSSLDRAPIDEDSDDSEGEGKDDNQKKSEAVKTPSALNIHEPVAGPWAAVGKHLHNALQEVHILLDALKITSRTYYLSPSVNALIQDDMTEADQIAYSKTYQLCTRKRALIDATRLIEKMVKYRQQVVVTPVDTGEGNFTKELRKLRENWRVRKIGSTIYGDLGYKTYVPKFAPQEIFDVFQKTQTSRQLGIVRFNNPSYVGVNIAHNLCFRSKLVVLIEPDDEKSALLLYKNRPTQQSINEDQIKHIHWKQALPWAQNTLICKDILSQLINESVSAQQNDALVSIATENSIVISLFDGLLIRVTLHSFPFLEREELSPSEAGIPFLSQTLRELFLAEHTSKPKRTQQFVTLPQTALPESLDMRGPQAICLEEVLSRMKTSNSLIKKFVDRCSHYQLVIRTIDFLQDYSIHFCDPQSQWKWVRVTPNFTLISLNFVNRGFENLAKFSSQIHITNTTITLTCKEVQQINCRRDVSILGESLLLLAAHFWVSSLNTLSRAYSWQILHANINAFDMEGNPAPTFYACNQTATKSLFIQFYSNGNCPGIFIRENNIKDDLQIKPHPTKELGGFRFLNYSRIPGSTLMRKMDNLLATFIN